MYARMEFDILADKLHVRTFQRAGDEPLDDHQVAEQLWAAFKFQLARDGGPGLFYAPLPVAV
jgi:hypothetical protein